MKSKLLHYLKESIKFILVMTIIANIISLYKSSSLNNKALTFSSARLLEDKNYIIDNSKPLLIHIWATWCPTCQVESSNIQKISKQFQVITIAVKSGSDNDIQKYLDKNRLDFMVINDTNASFAREFNIAAYPSTFVYNKNRELVFSDVGYTSTWGLWLRVWWAGL